MNNDFSLRNYGGGSNSNQGQHYVYWLGQDGNLWVNQNGNTRSIGRPVGDNWQNGYAEGSEFSMAGQGTLIDDPNPGNPTYQEVNNQGSYSYTQNAAQAAADAEAARKQREEAERTERERQRMIGYYDNIISQKNDAINRLSGSLRNELDKIEGDYKTYKNEQESTYNQQKNEYDNSSKQNTSNLVSNRNQITSNASAGLRGLLRILGAMGAGGSSAALYDAPSVVKRQADQEYANANKTYAQNQQNLDTDWGNYAIGFENDKKKLEDWRTGQLKSAEQENEQKRVNLLGELAEAYANRATYDADPGDNINQITNRIKESNQKIENLGKYSTPQYSGVTAVYESPALSSYDTGQTNLTTTVDENSTAESPSLLTVLRQVNKKKQASPYEYGTEV